MSNNSSPRLTISTGDIPFPVRKSSDSPNHAPATAKHCYITVLADFSGRNNRRQLDVDAIARRKLIEVDRDNFDDVFAAMNVQLQLAITDGVITFNELDDLHPDTLYQHIALFDKLRQLRKRLQSSSTFAGAAEEMKSWHGDYAAQLSKRNDNDASKKDTRIIDESNTADLLDAILSGQEVSVSGPEYNIDAMARSIVAPFLTDAPDPRQNDMIAAVDDATSTLMRKVMHVSDFQKLESTWQSLYQMVKRLETDSKLKIFICDISPQELAADATAVDSLEDTQTYKLLVSQRQQEGQKAISVVMADYSIADNVEDIRVAGMLAGIAASLGASAMAGGSERLAGCNALAKQEDVSEWHYNLDAEVASAWSSLRSAEVSRHLSLVVPRVLSRIPYGKRGGTVNAFDYEEVPSCNGHEYFLWGNGAWYLAMLVGLNFSQYGWSFTGQAELTIDRLPLYVYLDADGDSNVVPCAEIVMTDQTAKALRNAGLSVIRSILNKDSILIPAFTSVASGDEKLRGMMD